VNRSSDEFVTDVHLQFVHDVIGLVYFLLVVLRDASHEQLFINQNTGSSVKTFAVILERSDADIRACSFFLGKRKAS
jgi:hypothetical protein